MMKQIVYSRLLISVLFLCSLFFMVFPSQSSVIIDPGTYFGVGDETYSVSVSRPFDTITVYASNIVFNSTYFNMTPTQPTTIIITLIEDNISTAPPGYTIMTFDVYTTGNPLSIFISGFNAFSAD